jgi:predicted nucleic acid-binding protein
LDLADQREHVLDGLETIQNRLKPGRILVPPTVLQELVFLAEMADTAHERAQAQTALAHLRTWNLSIVNLVPVGHGIVEQIAGRLRTSELLSIEEYNDAIILAEAALLGCAILLTSDFHLRGLDFQKASVEMKTFDAEMPVIATPR